MAVTLVATAQNRHLASSSPTVTFPGTWTPAEDDLVVLFCHTINTTSIDAVPSDWVNVLGGTTIVTPGDTTCYLGVLYHWVTAGEASGGTLAYTITGLWAGSETNMVVGVVARGVDTGDPIDGFGTGSDAGNSTTHVLPVVDGATLGDDSLVVASVGADGAASYTDPSGWTPLETQSASDPGVWLGSRDAATVSGVDVAATNITCSISGEHVAGTVALKPAAGGGGSVTGAGSSTITATATAVGVRGAGGSASSTITASASAAGTRGVVGTAAATITASGTASGVRGVTGAAPSTITASAAGSGDVAHTGAGSSTIAATGTAAGVRGVTGAASSTITADASASGTSQGAGEGSGSTAITATATANGVRGVLGAGSTTITASATATDGEGSPTGAGSSTITASATATGVVGHEGQAASTVTVTATATGVRGVTGAGSSTITATATIVIGDPIDWTLTAHVTSRVPAAVITGRVPADPIRSAPPRIITGRTR